MGLNFPCFMTDQIKFNPQSYANDSLRLQFTVFMHLESNQRKLFVFLQNLPVSLLRQDF